MMGTSGLGDCHLVHHPERWHCFRTPIEHV